MGKRTWQRKARKTKPDMGGAKQSRANNARKNQKATRGRCALERTGARRANKTYTQSRTRQSKTAKTESQNNQRAEAIIALFPELQQQENQNGEAPRNTSTQNHIARTDIGTEHQQMHGNQMPEPTQQNWPIQETVINIESTYRKNTHTEERW